MADLEFYQDDSDENNEDGYGFDDGELEDLTPLQRLEKYLDSDNIFNRQMLARGLLDTLRAVFETDDNCTAVLDAMAKLSEDPEPSVRSELMEQVPHIAVYCQENKEAFVNAVPRYILPMVVRYLNDANSQVRKTSQAALLVLLEQELVAKCDIEEQVVQVILELASPDSLDDYRSEAAALMSKMAPLLGKDITERLFLPMFSEMCTDPCFNVRKVCAANFGEVATVVGVKNCEEHLLPKFFYLCEDGVWGVRKACAECFMTVSCACSPEVRRNELANLFVNLLCDQSRWVRMSAFQQLGPFISTFADAEQTGLTVNEEGNISLVGLESVTLDELVDYEDNDPASPQSSDHKDLSGILQLKSLDPPGTSTESSTDPEVEKQESTGDEEKSGETETSKASDQQTESSPNGADQPKETPELDKPQTATKEVVVQQSGDNPQIVSQSSDQQTGSQSDDQQIVDMELDPSEEESSSVPQGVAERLVFSGESDKSAEELRAESIRVQSPSAAAVDSSVDSLAQSSNSTTPCDTNSSSNNDGGGQAVTTTDHSRGDGAGDKPSGEGEGDHSGDTDNARRVGAGDSVSPSAAGSSDDGAASSAASIVSSENDPERVHVHLDNTFDSFQYWRSPLPEVNIDFDIINGQPTNIHVVAKVKDEDSNKVYASQMDVNIGSSGGASTSSSSLSDSMSSLAVEGSGVRIHTASVSTVSEAPSETVSHIGSTHVLGQHLGEQHLAIVDGVVHDLSTSSLDYIDLTADFGQDDATLAQQQSIVPQLLLENYLGMVDPSRAQTVDGEITRHCAYNLPAVALTLGRENWNCIKNLYETLAQDMQWKVRRTLAFSMHQLAVIVGDEITHNDLVPVFDGFLKDLDEVRIGVLKHLADIFFRFRREVRLQYLSRINDFMKTDNTRNWRFREELADQLIQVCELFHCLDVFNHIVPVAMVLCNDKVAQVRNVSLRLVSAILHKSHLDEEKKLLASICNNIIQEFATGERWLARQTFAQLCYVILEEGSLPPDVFARNFLPSLLHLGTDPVPNVRLAMAKVMAQRVMPLEYFTSQQNPYHEDLVHTQQKLHTDTDKDVRFFATHQPASEIVHEYHMVPV